MAQATPTPRPLGAARGLPAELLRGGLQHAPHARVGQVAQAELHRVDARLGRQDVDVRFAGEGVGVDRRRAPRPDGERVQARRVAALQPPAETVRWCGMS